MITRILIGFSSCLVILSAFADDPIAKIIKSQGESSATNAANQKRPLARGADIFKQDIIETTPSGFVTMRFTDGTVIDLAASTKYIVKDYNYNPAEPKKDKFSTEVVEGGFRAITGGIGTRSPTAFSAKARMTTLTVRGTYFYMMAPDCPSAPEPVPVALSCDSVLQFTIEGTTAINYKGNEYLIGPDQPNSTFDLQNGTVTLTNKIPTTLPMNYLGDVATFQKEVEVQAQTTGTSPTDPGTPTAPSSGGGGGNSPCGTLNAVGNSLPSTGSQ